MKIAQDVLSTWIALPEGTRALRSLMDDCGLEVKRVEEVASSPVFTLELLANRGDHHCYHGVALELNGRLGTGLARGLPEPLPIGDSPIAIRIDSERCLLYSATVLEKRRDGGVSKHALRVLEAAGIHSLTPPVDATNAVNLEIGQPTHAFDADRISGGITIRESVPGEKAWLLFTETPREIPAGTLVIADDEKILAVAGVIGCEDSKTTETTTRLLLESAAFDPVAVRKASRALDVHTDSSARFERGCDPTRVTRGAAYVVDLLERAGWARVGDCGIAGDWTDPERTISIDAESCSRFLDVSLSTDEIGQRLRRYGFTPAPGDSRTLQVTVPPHRLWDVHYPQDLYEELAKSIGYNETPIALPPVDMGTVPCARTTRKRQAEEVLIGAGFFEVFTDGFYGRDVRDRLCLDPEHPLWTHVKTANAIERGYAFLKNNALYQAVEAAVTNAHRRTSETRCYEWTRTFHPSAQPQTGDRRVSPCIERPILWAMLSGAPLGDPKWRSPMQPAGLLAAKGLLTEMGIALGLNLRLGPVNLDDPLYRCLHPNRQASILVGDEIAGILGEVHPQIRSANKLKKIAPIYLEISQSALLQPGSRPQFEEPPDWQPIERSLAFDLPHRVEASQVIEALTTAAPPWLLSAQATDLYQHDGNRAVTFSLVFANAPADHRSADDVNAAVERMAQRASSIEGVRQR